MALANQKYFDWYNDNDQLRMRYPSDLVVGFLIRNVKRNGRVLDAGCGSGRHVLLAAELGFDAHGYDLSRNGFDRCLSSAKSKNLRVTLSHGMLQRTRYPDNYFDAIICYSVINANSLEEQYQITKEFKRILHPEGCLLENFYGERDATAKLARRKGVEISKNTYRIPGEKLHRGIADMKVTYTCHISSSKEVEALTSGFSTVRIFDFELPYGNGSFNEGSMHIHNIFALCRGKNDASV